MIIKEIIETIAISDQKTEIKRITETDFTLDKLEIAFYTL